MISTLAQARVSSRFALRARPFELLSGALLRYSLVLAVRPWFPRASVIGGLGASLTFVITFSFLFTTPGLPAGWSGFLMKDLVLLGAALWSVADSLRAIERRQK